MLLWRLHQPARWSSAVPSTNSPFFLFFSKTHDLSAFHDVWPVLGMKKKKSKLTDISAPLRSPPPLLSVQTWYSCLIKHVFPHSPSLQSQADIQPLLSLCHFRASINSFCASVAELISDLRLEPGKAQFALVAVRASFCHSKDGSGSFFRDGQQCHICFAFLKCSWQIPP